MKEILITLFIGDNSTLLVKEDTNISSQEELKTYLDNRFNELKFSYDDALSRCSYLNEDGSNFILASVYDK